MISIENILIKVIKRDKRKNNSNNSIEKSIIEKINE